MTTKEARSMLGRLAGLRSAEKDRANGWPNAKRATMASVIAQADRRRVRELAESARHTQAVQLHDLANMMLSDERLAAAANCDQCPICGLDQHHCPRKTIRPD